MAELKTRILVVDDDQRLRELLVKYLSGEGYEVKAVADSKAMDKQLGRERYDLLVLDLMLPGEDGLAVCRRLRSQQMSPAIIMLTAKGDDVDRIVGLEMGADDYLPKPFNPRELLARIRAILRRATPARLDPSPGKAVPDPGPPSNAGNVLLPPERLAFAGFVFDLDAHRLFRGDTEIDLSTGDYEILAALVRHPKRVLSRDQLLDLAKGRSWEAYDRSVDVALSRLRRKVEEDPTQPVLIKT